ERHFPAIKDTIDALKRYLQEACPKQKTRDPDYWARLVLPVFMSLRASNPAPPTFEEFYREHNPLPSIVSNSMYATAGNMLAVPDTAKAVEAVKDLMGPGPPAKGYEYVYNRKG